MLTHSKIPKFAFIGTSSAGKTTATYQTCAYLKERGIRVDGILQQDRRMPFSPELLATHAEAQHWFIFNMMTTESYLALAKGTDCLVSDRSVLDFFAYMKYQWPDKVSDVQATVTAWLDTYTQLYYLAPRAYDDDGVRPTDEFRIGVDGVLKDLIKGNKHCVTLADDWLRAARDIAIRTKRASLDMPAAAAAAHLVGRWFTGTELATSPFDFAMVQSEWRDGMNRSSVSKAVFESFRPSDLSMLNEQNLINADNVLEEYTSKDLNIRVQVYQTGTELLRRLTKQSMQMGVGTLRI